MKKRFAHMSKSKFAIMITAVLLLAMLFSGLPYVLTHSTLFATSKAHAATLNPIQVENNLPGTPGWNDFSAALAPDTLSGFGSKISANAGDSIDLYVTTTAPSFTIDVFRTGYYGGVGARLMTSLGSFPGLHQAIPAPNSVTGMISCTNWTKTTTLTIPSTWVSGIYLAKLTSSTGNSSFIYFVVRDDGGSEDLLFQTSVTTYQAYNTWGGTSLYNNNLTNKTQYSYPHATKVSFDRPFNPGDSNGAGHYFFFEYKFVYWMEQQGYNVAYSTNIDTDARPGELLKHKAFLSVGHDEYWSMGMHNAVQSAISAGVNVAFFAANVMYWQIRLEPNSAGAANRVEVGYKDFATYASAPGPDPMWNVNNSLVTTLWRDPVVNMPENGMLGVMYEQQEDNDYAYIVTNASNWIYAGTGFVDGSSVPGIVGYEYDRVFNNGFTPAKVTVLSNSPVHGCCGGFSAFSNSTLYTAPSGARVFAAGTIQWSWGLAAIQSNTYTNAGIQKTTANILNNFIGSTTAPNSGVNTSSDNLLFGNQAINTTSAVQTVQVTNTTTTALTISNIAVTGTNASDFAQTNTCSSSLAANASCIISVTFKPTASGGRSGNITLTDSAAVSPQVIVVSGTGIASGSAVHLSATNLSFGNQTIQTTSAAQTVTITNTGAAALTFSFIQIWGVNANDFTQTDNCPTSLAVGATCTVSITFTPSALSTRAGSLTLTDNASDSAQQVILSGTGVAVTTSATLSPSNISFGNQTEGTTSTAHIITLTNSTTTALTISDISLTGTNAGDFAQTNTCPVGSGTLAVNASCAISVTFTPQSSSVDARTGNVTITSNGSGSPQTVTLSGTDVAKTASVSLTPILLSFGDQNNGTTSNAQTITLTNKGSATLAISSIALTGTNASDFAQTNTCPISPTTLAINASCTISVTFTPAASGARSASVAITDNADGEGEATQTAALSGTGVSTTTTLYFSDGFESGNFSQWTNGASGNGTASVQTAVVNSGTNAAQLTNAAGQSTQFSTVLNGVPPLTYTRFYFRFSSLSATTPIAIGQDASGHNQWIMYYDSGQKGLDIYFWNAAGTRFDLYSQANILSANTWYSIELEMNQATSGHGEVWLNGTSIGSLDGNLVQTQSYGKLILDNETTGSAYFDDVAVSTNFTIPTTSSAVGLVPHSLSFGNQIVNTTTGAQTTTVTNAGATALSISSIAVAGTNASDFAQTNTCPTSLAVNASCSISVTFTPGASGARSANITLTDSSADSPQAIALSGTGVATAPAVSLNVTSLSFGNQNTGVSSSAQSITVTNSGTAVLSISGIAVTGTNASDFTQTNTCGSSLAVSASCIISVTFNPAASGARSASVAITDNATGSPQTIALSGTGVGNTPPPTSYFSDGFESGNFSKWTSGANGTGAATVQTSVINSGTHAAQLTNAANQSIMVTTTVSGLPTLTYTRFYFRFASLSGTTLIALGQDASSHNQWIMYYDSGRQGLDAYFWNAAGTRYDVYSDVNVLSANTWYSIEVEMNQATSGHGEVWLNGTSIGSFDGNLVQTQSYGSLILDNEVTGTAYFDDVVISGSYNGLITTGSLNTGSQVAATTAPTLPTWLRDNFIVNVGNAILPDNRRNLG